MSIWHWAIVVGVVVVLFGRNKISQLMGDIGGGLRQLKKAGNELVEVEDKRDGGDS